MESFKALGEKNLHKIAVIKLNGGLGTSMGMETAKSLIPVKDGLSFLDLILLQAKTVRSHYGVEFPQVFMNSFKTHMDTMLKVGDFNNGLTGIDLAFLQHKYPKILAKDFTPASWPQNPELEWNPLDMGTFTQPWSRQAFSMPFWTRAMNMPSFPIRTTSGQ